MTQDQIIERIETEHGIPAKVTRVYVRTWWEVLRECARNFEPFEMRDYIDFPLHKWIFEKKAKGEDLPMPDGVRQALRDMELSSYNSRRDPGTLVHYRQKEQGCFRVGWILNRVGEDNLRVSPVLALKKNHFKGKTIWEWEVLDPTESEYITPDQYRKTGTVSVWLRNKTFVPVATAKGLIKKCKYFR